MEFKNNQFIFIGFVIGYMYHKKLFQTWDKFLYPGLFNKRHAVLLLGLLQ